MASGMDVGLRVVTNGVFFDPDTPHRIAGQCFKDGSPVQRRIVVRNRRTEAYIISAVTAADGTFDLRHLPEQQRSQPYVVTCYDDSTSAYGNALVIDHVYQVDDNGNPPQT